MQTSRWETARALTTVAPGGRGCNGWIRPEGSAPVGAPGSRPVLIAEHEMPGFWGANLGFADLFVLIGAVFLHAAD